MPEDRAVSEVLGYSLVFSLVIVSVAIISVGGLNGYQEAQDFERQSNAQKAFDVMHNNLEDIYYQSAPSRGTEIDLGETSLSLANPVVINVTVENPSASNREEFIIESQPIVQNLGDGNELVYEAGAVFQTSRGGGIIRQTPPMTLRGTSSHLIVPSIKQASGRSVGSGTVLIRGRSQGQDLLYQNTTRDPDVDLTINITSPRANLWYEYLTERGTFDDGDCDLSSSGEEVVCGPVTMEEVHIVESNVDILFDR